jgi:hypothetical protein
MKSLLSRNNGREIKFCSFSVFLTVRIALLPGDEHGHPENKRIVELFLFGFEVTDKEGQKNIAERVILMCDRNGCVEDYFLHGIVSAIILFDVWVLPV